ncbi:hypothetical protein V8F20_001983 [Naviculisporaceae sp. PSN 640]
MRHWFNSRATTEPAESAAGSGGNNNTRASPFSGFVTAIGDRGRTPAPDSPSSLNHSSCSPSPTPQPATPISLDSPALGHPNTFPLARSKPIAIKSPENRLSSTNSPTAPDFTTGDRLNPWFEDAESENRYWWLNKPDQDEEDLSMTTGNFEAAMAARTRQDSFVSAGPKPISMANPNRDHASRGRRESLAGSMMLGMSWGGISVGSFIREDNMMGTSPVVNHQSPSYHSNSYIPRLEANFMKDFRCCDRTWQTMHDLLQHYEESHHSTPQPAASRNVDAFGRGQTSVQGSNSRMSSLAPSMGRGQQPQQSAQGYQQPRQLGAAGANMGVGGIGQMMRQQHQQAAPMAQKSNQMSHLNDEMDAVGDMEMDDTVGTMDLDDTSHTLQQTRQLFGQQQRPQLQLNSSGLPHQALRTSQPPTPAAASFGFSGNPTVSSVNTPTLTTQQGLPQRGQQFSQENEAAEDEIPGMPMKMNLGNMNLNTQLGGLAFGGVGTIDDPAKRLYSPGGTTQPMTSQQRAFDQQLQMQQQLQQQLSSMNLDLSTLPPGVDAAMLLQQMTAFIVPPAEEHKPFRCPVIGCEKAYKNQNGLKYHKTHGHSTQQLHENGDGTFSIVNPETSTPYPGTLGMEKEKPFKCDVCGKRYKNLNGLKYHKQHSPMCDPEMRLQQQTLLSNMMSNPALLAMQHHGLPNINEDHMM